MSECVPTSICAVCQTARAAVTHARAPPREERVTRHLPRHGRRAITCWGNRRRFGMCRECDANGVARVAMPNQTPATVALRSAICAQGMLVCVDLPTCNGAPTKGLPVWRYLYKHSGVRRREGCPKRRTRPPALGARRQGARDRSFRDVSRNLPLGEHRRLDAAFAQPPTQPMWVPDMNQKKLELCRLSAAEVSAFHSGLFSHHCR